MGIIFTKKNVLALIFRSKRLKNFRSFIAIILFLSLLTILYRIEALKDKVITIDDIWNPSWMFFGPLIFFANYSLYTNENSLLKVKNHLVLPFIITLYYVLIVFKIVEYPAVINIYRAVIYLPIASLLYYCTLVIIKQKYASTYLKLEGEIITILTILFLLLAIKKLLALILISLGYHEIKPYDRFLVYILLTITVIILSKYIIVAKFIKIYHEFRKQKYFKSYIEEEEAQEYFHAIQKYFKEDLAFLNSNISLSDVSNHLNIPKHICSQVLNIYQGMNFYKFLAYHRINYAIELLNTSKDELTLEALAYECGFNSKSAFNKNFKEITGFTPASFIVNKSNS